MDRSMDLIDAMMAELAAARREALAWRPHALAVLLGSSQGEGEALDHLLHRLERAGFGDAVRSWAGPGPCRRIPPEQIHAALGKAEIQRMAGRAGMTDDELAAELSQHLPRIVAQVRRASHRHPQGTP
jgi:uncharacterized protein YidB (DUF937 family)